MCKEFPLQDVYFGAPAGVKAFAETLPPRKPSSTLEKQQYLERCAVELSDKDQNQEWNRPEWLR